MENIVKCQDGLYYAYPGYMIVLNLLHGRKMKMPSTDSLETNDVVLSITTEPVPVDSAYIMGSRFIVPGYYSIQFSRQNISKKYFKAMFVEWLYDNDDQIAIMLNKDSKKQADKDKYNDMQAVRVAAGEFADIVIEKLNELLANEKPAAAPIEEPNISDNNDEIGNEAENSESNTGE